MTESKPLNWTPAPGVGYSVIRRGDGGMTLTFTDLSDATLAHWHEFALEHLLGADRRTRNLGAIPEMRDAQSTLGRELQSKNKQVVADLTLDKRILQEALRKKF